MNVDDARYWSRKRSALETFLLNMTMPKPCMCYSFAMKFQFVERKSGADVTDFYDAIGCGSR